MMQWLLQLLPKQKMQGLGDGNVQAGRVGGDVNHTQHSTTQHIYNTFYLLPSDTGAANEANKAVQEPPATPEQHEVLRLMRLGPSAKSYAEDFMLKQFKTVRVKSLDDLQCKRTRRWIEVCLQNEARAKSEARKTG